MNAALARFGTESIQLVAGAAEYVAFSRFIEANQALSNGTLNG
jgi:hypothetical protein